MFVQLPNGRIHKFLGFAAMQSNENSAHIYYESVPRDDVKKFSLEVDNYQDTEMFVQHGYSEEGLKLIEQRIVSSLKNHDDLVVIPKPEDVCKLNDGGYYLLFNTISNTESGNDRFQKMCDNVAKSIANKEIDATTLIPITLYGDPTKYDVEWITNMMLSAKFVRVSMNSENNALWKIVHRIALKHGLDVQSITKIKTYISDVPVVKSM